MKKMFEHKSKESKRFWERFPFFWLEVLILAVMCAFFCLYLWASASVYGEMYYSKMKPMEETIVELADSETTLTPQLIFNRLKDEIYIDSMQLPGMGFVVAFYDVDGNITETFMYENAGLNKKAYEYINKPDDLGVESMGIKNGNVYITTTSFYLLAAVENNGMHYHVIYGYAPKKLALLSSYFWFPIVLVCGFCQGGALLFFKYQKYIRKKKQELRHMRNTFIDAMAHEMKTPAAVIRNSAECVQDNVNSEKNPYYLEMIVRESERMNELLLKMLMYTRTSDGAYALHKEQISLVDVVEKICASQQLAAEFRGLTIKIKEEHPAHVWADAVLIKVVLDNLISNAVKYATENSRILITLSETGCFVYNQGKRFTEEELERIWEPLYMTDISRGQKEGSSGMGLAICKNILELHGAKYGVENVEDGIRFFFYL